MAPPDEHEKGYTVLPAASADEALRAAATTPIDLFLADAVLPGTSGRDLADRISTSRRGLRVLFMSGHTTEEASRLGLTNAGIPFLQKPFTAAELLRKVRDVLSA